MGGVRAKFEVYLCDRIQSPAPGNFTSDDLEWYKGEAWIPRARLVDFLKGEETRPNFNTCFKVRGTETRQEKSAVVSVRYWCSFGPLDQRIPKTTRVEEVRILPDGSVPLRKKANLGASCQRGCRWHFIVVFMDKERPHGVLLRMHNKEHNDTNGKICHGLLNPTTYEHGAHVAPRISIELREEIERLLRTGLTPRSILKIHRSELNERYRRNRPNDQGEVFWSRDMALSLKDVHNVLQSINKRRENWSSDNAVGLKLWVQAHACQVLLYQEPNDCTGAPFQLVFATQWMINKLSKLGHNNVVAMDGTFGTNEYGYELYTILGFDEFQNGIPCCWALTRSRSAKDLTNILRAVKGAVESAQEHVLQLPGCWAPSCFLVDCAEAEHLALSELWPTVPLTLCLWHVRRAWTKQILKKVCCPSARALIYRELGDIVYRLDTQGALDASIAFMARWKSEQPTFLAYYNDEWHHRIDKWVVHFQKYKHANQSTNGAIERWHATLKLHLRMERPFKKGRKVVWLVTQLLNEMEHFYWCMSCLKWQGRVRNKSIENFVRKSILQLRLIPNDDVVFEEGGQVALVRSQSSPNNEWHALEDYNSNACVCSCAHSAEGNTCKHQVYASQTQGRRRTKGPTDDNHSRSELYKRPSE